MPLNKSSPKKDENYKHQQLKKTKQTIRKGGMGKVKE